MKIMLIGAATSNHTKRWVKAMAERGHDVLLVCRPDQKDNMNELPKDVKVQYLKYGGKSFSYYLNAPCLKQIYKDFNPDVVNAHYASGYGTLARIARLKPLVISVWGSDVYSYPYNNKFNYHLIRKNLKYADAVASTSNAMAKQVHSLVPEKDIDVTVTPFGVDIERFSPDAIRNDNTRPVIGIVKYLETIYDIPLLIKSFAILYNESVIKPLLSIYGSGSLLEELQQLTRELDVEEAVTFYGTIPNSEVPNVLRTFDVFVNCSLQESFGVAIVEAMACEIPVVATDTPGFREVVDDNKTGIIVKDREPQTMADALKMLLENEELRKSYGKAGREKVVSEYDWKKNVEKMETLYTKVLIRK